MSRRFVHTFYASAVGVAYWVGVTAIAGSTEPWDAEGYWTLWYPCSLALGSLASVLFRQAGWLAGAAVTGAQLPVVLINGIPGPLLPAGLVILAILAVPAMVIAALSARIAKWMRAR